MRTYSDTRGPDPITRCQLFDISTFSDGGRWIATLERLVNRLKRFTKRRLRYVLNMISELQMSDTITKEVIHLVAAKTELQPGDYVRVRSRDEIQACLNSWNQLKKCSFMEEMWKYCDTTQRVLKKVEKFLDERDYSLKKCSGLYILDGVMCDGTVDFGKCDRSCFFFWREEWLDKIEVPRQMNGSQELL